MHGYARLSRAGLGASFVPLGTLSEACERESRRMNSQAVGNALWAYATLGAAPPSRTMAALDAAAEREAKRMNAQEVSNALWAFATLGAPPTDPTFRELERAAAREAPRPRGAGLFFL